MFKLMLQILLCKKNIVNLFKNYLEVLTDPNKNLSEKEKRTKKPIPIKVTKKTYFNIIINEYYVLSIIYEMSSLNVLRPHKGKCSLF